MLCVIFFFPILNLSIQGNEGKFHDAREENDLYLFRNVFWIVVEITKTTERGGESVVIVLKQF
jgi:hypothetical protein